MIDYAEVFRLATVNYKATKRDQYAEILSDSLRCVLSALVVEINSELKRIEQESDEKLAALKEELYNERNNNR